jgi:hypothetical protein
VESSYENVSIQKQIQPLKELEAAWAAAVTIAARTVGVTPPK